MSVVYSAFSWAPITNNAGTGTSISVSTGTGARFPNGAQETRARIYLLTDPGINEEVLITNRSSDSLTVTRNTDSRGALTVTSSGYAIDVVEALGAWHGPPSYSAGDYASSSGGWDVSAATFYKFRWKQIGRTLIVQFAALGMTITGTPTSLQLIIPGSYVAAEHASAKWWGLSNGSVVHPLAWVQTSVSTTRIYIYVSELGLSGGAAWAASAGNGAVGGQIELEIT